MKAVKKDVFDINKVTVVGSPTITSDGVASEFSTSDYLTLPATAFNPKSSIWEIRGSFVGATSTATQVILTKTKNTYFGLRLLLSTANKISLEVSNNGTSHVFSTTSNLSITLGKKYYFKLKFTGTQYILDLSENNILWTNYITQNDTNTVYDDVDNPITIGAKGNQFFAGSIDLKQFKIYVDGELVYSPTRPTIFLERRKEGFDLSKFTVVGSPTITEDGVLDGSTTNSSNYLTIPYDITNAKSVRVEFEATSIVYDGSITYAGALFGLSTLPFYVYVSNKGTTAGIDMRIGSSSGSALLSNSYNFTPAGSKVKFVWELKNGVWTISLENSVGYTQSKTIAAEEITDIKTSGIISISKTSQWWLTNLPSISITVDGKEVFTGAKEKFYAIGD